MTSVQEPCVLTTLKLNTKLNNKGITLIELVIAMLVMGIIIAPMTRLFRPTLSGFFTGSPQLRLQEALNDAMNEITDNIRDSRNITGASNISINFTDIGLNIITYRINSTTNVIERLRNGILTGYIPYYNTNTTRDKINLTLSFSYFSVGGNGTTPWTSGNTNDISAVNVTISGILRTDQLYTLNSTNIVKLRVK